MNAEYIFTHGSLKSLTALLNYDDSEIVADIITSLIYLYDHQKQQEINNSEVIKTVKNLKNSNDKRLANLATVFLQNVCGSF